MKHFLTAAALVLVPAVAEASTIERACMSSGRPAANSQICSCIQQAADLTLSNGDQRRAAKFFRDPHAAQVVRQSDRRSDEEFWLRYKSFGQMAEVYCGG